jgi:hypothetical protein
LLFVFGVTGLMVSLAVAMAISSYDIWGGLLIGMILLMLTIPFATRASRRWNDPQLGRIILAAAFMKLAVGSSVRYFVAYSVYGNSDAERYYVAGQSLAPFFRQGDFGHGTGSAGSGATHFIEGVAGFVIAIINESRLGAFVVFSWFSFIGLYLFYTAFRVAFPQGDHRRYCLLIFFWPSLLYWPSSVGKDAWMVWTLGMCALGLAQLYVGKWRGFIWLGIGIYGSILVRPHIALIVMAAAFVGLLLRRNRGAYSRMLARPSGTVLLLVGMILVGTVLFQRTESFFNLESLDVESAQGVLENTTEITSEGGSGFTAVDPNSPVGYVQAVVTVLFRPFPFEVSGAAVFTALEGTLLAGLIVASRKRIKRVLRMSLQNAYVAFSIAYTFAFIYGFASVSNFGILARERSQLFPILFIILAVPLRDDADSATADAPEDSTIDETALAPAT